MKRTNAWLSEPVIKASSSSSFICSINQRIIKVLVCSAVLYDGENWTLRNEKDWKHSKCGHEGKC